MIQGTQLRKELPYSRARVVLPTIPIPQVREETDQSKAVCALPRAL